MFLKYLVCSNVRRINICILLPQDNYPTNERSRCRKESRYKTCCYEQNDCLEIISSDEESKRIFSHVVLFTSSALIKELFDSLVLIVMGHYLGSSPSLTAYACVNLFLGITDSAIYGVTDASILLAGPKWSFP